MNINKRSGDFYTACEGSVEGTGRTEQEAITNLEAKLATVRREIDWKLALMKILKVFGNMEGVWFERHWDISEEDKLQIELAYNEFDK